MFRMARFKPGLHNFFGMVPVLIWPRCLKFSARHPPSIGKMEKFVAQVPQNIGEPRLPIHMVLAPVFFGALVPQIFPVT